MPSEHQALKGVITVVHYRHHSEASLTDHHKVRGSGPTPKSAIGDLITKHPSEVIEAVKAKGKRREHK